MVHSKTLTTNFEFPGIDFIIWLSENALPGLTDVSNEPLIFYSLLYLTETVIIVVNSQNDFYSISTHKHTACFILL